MNTRKSLCSTGVLALFAATAIAAVAFQVRGNISGPVTSAPLSATQSRLTVNLAGQLSHLGKTHTVFETVADFSGPVPVPVSSNVGVITAANGDQIFFTQHWAAAPLGGNEYRVTAAVQAVAGTGRFAGISGSGSYSARFNLANGTASADVEGALFR
jgi:hypothetical protein